MEENKKENVAPKKAIISVEITSALEKKFNKKCEEIGIDTGEAFELLIKGFAKGSFAFKETKKFDI